MHLESPMTSSAFGAHRREHTLNRLKAVSSLSDLLSQMVAAPRVEGHLGFYPVRTPEQWEGVLRFRLEQYEKRLPYMLHELGPDGTDALDARSTTFAAQWNGDVVATIRLTPHPYETSQYVSEDSLTRFLGEAWDSSYLEWSRLLIDGEAPIRRLMPAMLVYAGLHVLSSTRYSHYFGYASLRVQPVFARFRMTADTETFSIPKRGDHAYALLKGDFADSLHHFIERLRTPVLSALASYHASQSC